MMPFTLVQSVYEENWECVVLEQVARLKNQFM
jgi:hypothetical protein